MKKSRTNHNPTERQKHAKSGAYEMQPPTTFYHPVTVPVYDTLNDLRTNVLPGPEW